MKNYTFFFISVLIIFFSYNLILSNIPEIITYQCFVKGPDNVPLNGIYQVTFSIYENEDAKESIWKEIVDATFTDGFANLYIGKKQSLANLDFSKKYWFSIAIGNGEEFKPRIELTSVPYSFMAKNVDASSGNEGDVLMIKSGKAQWISAGGVLKLPFAGSSNTSEPALQIHQTGKGSTGIFSRLVVPNKFTNQNETDHILAADSSILTPVFEVKEEHQKNSPVNTITRAVFGAHSGFLYTPTHIQNNKDDSPLNLANYSGTKIVGFFCLDSTFGVNRYSEIAEEYPTAIYARTLSNVGNVGRFIMDNEINIYPTIEVMNRSKGHTAVFKSNNTSSDKANLLIETWSQSNSINIKHLKLFNDNPAIYIENMGENFGIYSEALTRGGAARFAQKDPNSRSYPCLTAHTEGLVPVATFYSMNSLNDSTALQVEQNGRGPTARFYINNTNNGAVSVVGNTSGLGRAGQFAILNTNNEQAALAGITVGKGASILGYTNSTQAYSGVFYTDNNQSTQTCIYATTTGLGFVGQFVSGNNQPNNRSTLYGGTTGKGNAGEFIVSSNDNSMAAVYGYHNNKGVAFYGKHEGTGRTASFEQMNIANSEPTIFASTKGSGPVIYARNDGSGFVAQFSIPSTSSNNSPVLVIDNQRGRKGMIVQSTATTDEPALEVLKGGTNKQAAFFGGNVHINGTLSKQAGAFTIDHPLDPENKYLSHSFVESPDMKNIYDGIAILDENGEATVELPAWFQALNKDFRYQLTCIGGYAQVYISQEIENNKFKIAGGRKNLKVSWQVTGIRHDKYAEKYPIIVEQDKPESQKGILLCPDDSNTYNSNEKINKINNEENSYKNLNIDFNKPINKDEGFRSILLNNNTQKANRINETFEK